MPVRRATFGLCIALVSFIIYLTIHYVTNAIHKAVDEPYMDEIFHVPQAKLYCRGNFSHYDPKITTPPGLYILAYFRIWIRDKLVLRRNELVCGTIDLRRTNNLVTICNFLILVLIQLSSRGRHVIHEKRVGLRQRVMITMDQSSTYDLARILLTAVSILALPPLFFFNSLFYTDAGSLLFTLVSYLFSINDHDVLAAVFGAISITFRQPNIIWLFYTTCLLIDRIVESAKLKPTLRKSSTTRDSIRVEPGISKWLNKLLVLTLIRRCWPYAVVGLSFIAFVVINKGLALGDKEAHQPRLHLAQILYFLGFCSVFGFAWMFQIRIMKRFLYFIIRNPLTAVIATGLILYLTAYDRYAHPYLLADNRHIVFYIWRRILDRNNSFIPYLLAPIYLFSSLSIWNHFRNKGFIQVLLYIFCTMLVIVPNGLLELRYYIIPYVILRLNAQTSLVTTLMELAQHMLINIAMHNLFLNKTFRWADSSEIQRIMW